jgi:uncharacterized membrane protein
MAFCPNCGASVEGRFCAKCGTAVGTGAPGTGSGPGAGSSQPPPAAAAGGLTDNAASALSYVLGLVTGILFLVLTPYNQNRNIRFHAFQSIFLNVAWIVVWFVFSFITGMFLQLLGLVLIPLVGLGFFILWLVLIIKTYQGQKVVLPVIGPLAEQQA